VLLKEGLQFCLCAWNVKILGGHPSIRSLEQELYLPVVETAPQVIRFALIPELIGGDSNVLKIRRGVLVFFYERCLSSGTETGTGTVAIRFRAGMTNYW
jgi:hypothetical protein